MQNVKDAVHRLTNHLQLILSYLEAEEYAKALESTKVAAKELRGLAKMLTGLAGQISDSATVRIPTGGAVVVPHGSRVVSHDDVNVDIAPDEVRVVDRHEVIDGRGDDNNKTK